MLAKELREKLEKKAFEIAMQYHLTADFFGDYTAAIKTFDNFLIDYPGTPLKEDALFYKFDASYRFAINSVAAKMPERLENAKANYKSLIKFKPDTKYKEQADEMLATIDTELASLITVDGSMLLAVLPGTLYNITGTGDACATALKC